MTYYTIEDFDIKKLGSFYQPDRTVFRVFAPDHKQLFLQLDGSIYTMHRNGMCFEIALAGNLEKVTYNYVNDKGVSFKDPFAYLSIGKESIVLDKNKFISNVVTPKENKTKIIYEASVRDFSSDSSYNGKVKSKFLSFTEGNLKIDNYFMIGLDYLKNIGISHLQLMPIFDFDNDKSEYNWGYNPIAYNYVKADYVFDQKDPYAYINELRNTINILHSNDIRVVLDVVFNHVYNAHTNDLEKMLPGRIFRYTQDGKLANGTLCGNEINSEDPFVREYIVLMILRYLQLFDIDGIRMDLMNILDIDTINKIKDTLTIYKKDFLVYGEGWNMGDVLPDYKRATISNYKSMPKVGLFNDKFRDVITSFLCGDESIKHEVKNVLACDPSYLDKEHSINYLECHDGLTFYDRMLAYKPDDDLWLNERRCKLALAMVMLSRGTPFIHMGQEFYRSKSGIENSYNAGDEINRIDWNLRVNNNRICDYFKDLVEIRKEYDVFDKDNVNISFDDYYECLIYKLDNIKIFINPSVNEHVYDDGNQYEVIFDKNGKCEYHMGILKIPACGLLICKE